jgi:hypothetical protein
MYLMFTRVKYFYSYFFTLYLHIYVDCSKILRAKGLRLFLSHAQRPSTSISSHTPCFSLNTASDYFFSLLPVPPSAVQDNFSPVGSVMFYY